MKIISNLLTKPKTSSPEINEKVTKIMGTLCIILSGFILYLDKIFSFFNITVDNLHGWSNQENYIWSLCQTISPVLIMLGMYLRPYFIALTIPAFCYSLQFYFVMNSAMTIDRPLTWVYVTGTSLLVLLVIRDIKKVTKKLYTRLKKPSDQSEIIQDGNRYEKIKIMLSAAKESYNKGEITSEMYLSLVENIEKDFLALKKEIDDENARRMLNKYISKIS
jgi:hypothetical protein